MVDRQKAFNIVSSRDHCQRSSPSWIFDKPQAGFEPALNISLSFALWSCAVVITTIPMHQSRYCIFFSSIKLEIYLHNFSSRVIHCLRWNYQYRNKLRPSIEKLVFPRNKFDCIILDPKAWYDAYIIWYCVHLYLVRYLIIHVTEKYEQMI